jgi:hypothetical protein
MKINLKKGIVLTLAGAAIIGFSGCGVKQVPNDISIFPNTPISTGFNEQEKVGIVIRTNQYVPIKDPFNAENAIYHLAKYAKEHGYNYIQIIKPKVIAKYMPNSVEDLNKCLNASGRFQKCEGAKNLIYASGYITAYDMDAMLYKKQPVEVPTISVDEILQKYKKYDLTKKGYTVKIEKD